MTPSTRAAIAALALYSLPLTSACGAANSPPVVAPIASAATSAWATHDTVATPARCGDGMVGVPASTAAGGPSSPFCIDATEVTTADYATCLKAGVCSPRNDSCVQDLPSDEGTYPARCMTWDDATAHCTWKGKRLPTEAEWVLAACGTDGRTYPWGNDKPTSQVCWMGEPGGFRGTTQRGPCRVGSFTGGKSPVGMLDAAGNVEEWTATGPGKWERVIRGGAFNDSWLSMQCGKRVTDTAGATGTGRGFRCAASPR